MRAAFYPNSNYFVPSSPINPALSANENHPLLLSETDRISINRQFLRQLNHCGFTQRECQIVTTVYSQTIDFNKFEDDMNGTRLKQLTGLFPHHANATIRDLETLHVLITRKGYYGKYLSINFNFSQWGQQVCNEAGSHDPTILLESTDPLANVAQNNQQQHADTPINHVAHTAVSEPMLQASMQTNADYVYSHDLLKQLLESMTTLTAKVTRQEEILNDLLKDVDLLAAIKNQPQTEQNKDLLENETETEAEAEAENEKIVIETETPEINQQQTVEAAITITTAKDEHTAKSIEPVEPVTEAILEANALSLSNEPEKPWLNPSVEAASIAKPDTKPSPKTIETMTSTAIATLQFPTQFSAEDCQYAETMLGKTGDKAQLLLDMLQKRLANHANPVRDPFAYLGSLLNRLQNNKLDMSPPTTAITATIDPCQPPPISALQQCKDDFREASADCQQMEQNLKRMAEKDQMSFQQYTEHFAIKEMWDGVKNRFIATKKALTSMQAMNAVVAVA